MSCRRMIGSLLLTISTKPRSEIGPRFISDIRVPYNDKDNLLLEANLSKKCPFHIFTEWFCLAKSDPRIVEANAMSLATANKCGVCSVRMMLLKKFNKDGFTFFTHYTSRKGHDLEENPFAALLFYWGQFTRTISIEGDVEKVSLAESDEYFSERPYKNQIGTHCSDQSKPILGRKAISDKEVEMKAKYKEGQVPRPPNWGGFIVKPKSIEFLQGQTDRTHDRIRFRRPKENEPDGVMTHKGEGGWIYERLSP